MKNSFALVSRTPPEIFSLIPDYCEDGERDDASINSTHVCRRWRKLFISRSSLWTRLDCTSIEKTSVYIERSKTSPLEIRLHDNCTPTHSEEAFLLVVPHIGRVKTISSFSWMPFASDALFRVLVEHFSRPLPLLEKLEMEVRCNPTPTFPSTLFNGDLSSLRELSLAGVLMPLPPGNLENLTVFNLSNIPAYKVLLTHLLDVFESAPHLHDVQLKHSALDPSNIPPGRIATLPNLKKLMTIGYFDNSILLRHLSIPSGAQVVLEFTFRGGDSSIPRHIPYTLDNLHNLSHITSMNLCFGPKRRAMRLKGPSGELYTLGNWIRGRVDPEVGTARLLPFFNRFDISKCQFMGITQYCSRTNPSLPITAWATYQFLFPMGNLRVLTLIESDSLAFILSLNPDKNPDNIVLCPTLEEIILYIDRPDRSHVDGLWDMAEERRLRGVKLSAITIISTCALMPTMEVFRLREHVSRVEYKFDNAPPAWDTLPRA